MRLPVPGQQFGQPVLRDGGDTGEDVGEPGLGIDIVELGGCDQCGDGRCPVRPVVGACEQPGFAAEGKTPEAALGGVIGPADSAIIEERGEAVSALEPNTEMGVDRNELAW